MLISSAFFFFFLVQHSHKHASCLLHQFGSISTFTNEVQRRNPVSRLVRDDGARRAIGLLQL